MKDGARLDLHAVLGVDEKAGPEELRRAYLALAVKYHPDRNPGDAEAEERFKDISQAYAVLSDPVARARYERLAKARRGPAAGAAGPEPKSAGGTGGSGSDRPGSSAGRPRTAEKDFGKTGGPDGQNSAEPDFEDVLSGFFKSAKGRDLLKDLENELKKAGLKFSLDDFAGWVKGRQKTAAPGPKSWWRRLAGWRPGAANRARREAARYEISYQLALTISAAAAGTTVDISYPRDDGERRLKIKIPAGAKDGARLRLSGQGRLKPDGSRGDLVLTIGVGSGPRVADLWR